MFVKCKHCGETINVSNPQLDAVCQKCGATHNVDDIYYGSLILKGYSFLSQGSFEEAQETFEEASGVVKESGDAYLGVILSESKVSSLSQLLQLNATGVINDPRYVMAKNKANNALRTELLKFEQDLRANSLLNQYMQAKKAMQNERYFEALGAFESLGEYKDSFELKRECKYHLGIFEYNALIDPNTKDVANHLQRCKAIFQEIRDYKDSESFLKKVADIEEGINRQNDNKIKEEYLRQLRLSYYSVPSISSYESLFNSAKQKQSLKFPKEFKEVKETQDKLLDEVRTYVIKTAPTVIKSINKVERLACLVSLLKTYQVNDCFKDTLALIEQRRKEIVKRSARRARKAKKIIIFSSIAAALVIVTAIVLSNVIPATIKKGNYNQASHNMENGNYDDAITYYKKTGNSEKAINKISVCQGLKLIEDTMNNSINDNIKETLLIQGFNKIVDGGETVDVYYDEDSGANSLSARQLYATDGCKKETVTQRGYQLYVPTRQGDSFKAWRTEELAYEQEKASVKLHGVWESEVYHITYVLDGGVNSANNPSYYTYHDETITLSPANKNGSAFTGWYDSKGYQVTSIPKGSTGDITLYARYEAGQFRIVYELNGGSNSPSNPSSYSPNGAFFLSDPARAGYSFVGWYDGSNTKITAIDGSVMSSDIYLIARWSPLLNSLIVASSDSRKGSATVISGSGYTNETIVVSATPQTNCVFDGWYHNGSLVSTSTTYEFQMPPSDYYLDAYFRSYQSSSSSQSQSSSPSSSQAGSSYNYLSVIEAEDQTRPSGSSVEYSNKASGGYCVANFNSNKTMKFQFDISQATNATLYLKASATLWSSNYSYILDQNASDCLSITVNGAVVDLKNQILPGSSTLDYYNFVGLYLGSHSLTRYGNSVIITVGEPGVNVDCLEIYSDSPIAVEGTHIHDYDDSQRYDYSQYDGYTKLQYYYCTECGKMALEWEAKDYDASSSGLDSLRDDGSFRFGGAQKANSTNTGVTGGGHLIYKLWLNNEANNVGLDFLIQAHGVTVPIFDAVAGDTGAGVDIDENGNLITPTKRYALYVNGQRIQIGADPGDSSEKKWFTWPVTFSLQSGENIIELVCLGGYRAYFYNFRLTGLPSQFD